MKQNTKGGNLHQVKEELERRLIVMRYSKVTASAYMRIYGWLENYLEGYGETSYSKEAGQRFLVEYSLQANHAPTQFSQARMLVRRLDEILENKMFTPRFHKAETESPLRFKNWYGKYLEHLTVREFKKSTITTRKRYVGQLLARFPDTVSTLEELTASDLYHVFTKYEWPSVAYTTAKVFLVFLFENGVTKADLSVCVPKPSRPRSLPSVYKSDEVLRLLSSVDRTTCMGKRDYAILILAANLGLRSSDIVNLSLKDVDYKNGAIEIVQVKTERPLTLVMNNDVKEAISDYVKNSRPISSSDKIFLGFRAPLRPLTAGAGYDIVRKYFDRAGIATQGRRRGTHALRTSYATALVAKGTP